MKGAGFFGYSRLLCLLIAAVDQAFVKLAAEK